MPLILKCDREDCDGEYVFESLDMATSYGELNLPLKWFERGGKVYCPRHFLREERTFTIMDREETT